MIRDGLALWDEEVAPDERDRLLDRVAQGVVRRGMAVPAVVFLEMHRPLSFFASQGIIVLSPLLAPIVGLQNCRLAARLLEDRANIERLVCRIEAMQNAK